MKLTANQRAALQDAHTTGEIRRTHDDKPGKPPWPHHAATLHSLVNRELLACGARRNRHGWSMETWTITDAGRKALYPAPRPLKDTVHGMRAKGAAQTRTMVGGIWQDRSVPEPEKVNADSLPSHWRLDALERHERDRPATGRRRAA